MQEWLRDEPTRLGLRQREEGREREFARKPATSRISGGRDSGHDGRRGARRRWNRGRGVARNPGCRRASWGSALPTAVGPLGLPDLAKLTQ